MHKPVRGQFSAGLSPVFLRERTAAMELDEEGGIKLIVGHCGSGKTEFALNYSLGKAREGKRVLLADLDIVNPFYRARNKTELLKERGIDLIESGLDQGIWADIPALSPRIFALFDGAHDEKIADVGGDPAGAGVLGRFLEKLDARRYEMWMVVNANRPETQTAGGAIRLLEEIERASRLKVSGLISNTHMGEETRWEDILSGAGLCREIGRLTGLSTRFTCLPENLRGMPQEGLAGETMIIKRYLLDIWSQGGNSHGKNHG